MLIVDAQIHLWKKGTPSAHHRQEPYSSELAIAGMDAAGVDRALVHPVLAVEAVRKYPDRFAIMGWLYLDAPNGRDLGIPGLSSHVKGGCLFSIPAARSHSRAT
jgi:hypothetical protein